MVWKNVSSKRASSFASVLAALATLAAAGLAYLAWCTAQDQFKRSQRAWLAPVAAKIGGELSPGGLADIEITVENSGNDVAVNVLHRGIGKIISVPKNSHGKMWFEAGFPENKTCDLNPGASIDPFVVYPGRVKEPDIFVAHTLTGGRNGVVPKSLFEPVDLSVRPGSL
jgi:hypothetical protein